ncbi:MAG: hypothetical protein Q8K75_08785 [Chlamydiales bacterium]|nr:hypothetical protein [Chlamydiales bacterium]
MDVHNNIPITQSYQQTTAPASTDDYTKKGVMSMGAKGVLKSITVYKETIKSAPSLAKSVAFKVASSIIPKDVSIKGHTKDSLALKAKVAFSPAMIKIGQKATKAWIGGILGGKDRVIVSCSNVAKTEILRTEQDVSAAKALKAKIMESHDFKTSLKHEQNAPELGKATDAFFVQSLHSSKSDSAIMDGICFGTSVAFMQRYLEGGSTIRDIAQEFSGGMPADAAANQAVYQELATAGTLTGASLGDVINDTSKHRSSGSKPTADDIKAVINVLSNEMNSIINRETDPAQKEIMKQGRDLQDISVFLNTSDNAMALLNALGREEGRGSATRMQAFSTAQGLVRAFTEGNKEHPTMKALYSSTDHTAYDVIVKARGMKISSEDPPGLSPASFSSTKEQVKHLDNLKDGTYLMTIDTGSAGHAMNITVEDGRAYILDPNIGLIDCKDNRADSVLKLVYTYAPPASSLSKDEPNYNLTFRQVERNSSIVTERPSAKRAEAQDALSQIERARHAIPSAIKP